MSVIPLNEFLVEEVALEWFESCGFTRGHAPNKHGFPRDKQAEIAERLLEQAETLSEGWGLAM